MKVYQQAALIGVLLAVSISASARIVVPEHDQFSYRSFGSGRIDVSSVCAEYGGVEWKNCRRYAQWYFSNQCRELSLKERRTSDLHPNLRKSKQFFCHAAKAVTPLK